MIKYALTKKQQFVLCAMYIESLSTQPPAVQCADGSVRILMDGSADCSIYTMCYLQHYGLVGVVWFLGRCWALTSEGEELAKTLLRSLS